MTLQIVRGNALALPLADESVDLVITSPPYFWLRSYVDGGYGDGSPSKMVEEVVSPLPEPELGPVREPGWYLIQDDDDARKACVLRWNGTYWLNTAGVEWVLAPMWTVVARVMHLDGNPVPAPVPEDVTEAATQVIRQPEFLVVAARELAERLAAAGLLEGAVPEPCGLDHIKPTHLVFDLDEIETDTLKRVHDAFSAEVEYRDDQIRAAM